MGPTIREKQAQHGGLARNVNMEKNKTPDKWVTHPYPTYGSERGGSIGGTPPSVDDDERQTQHRERNDQRF